MAKLLHILHYEGFHDVLVIVGLVEPFDFEIKPLLKKFPAQEAHHVAEIEALRQKRADYHVRQSKR